jgi:DNA-binding SARP family transcriptional activator/tetratricopeptide (TPR) repeat protein
MIALAWDKGLDRDTAAALLWSRSPEGQARANLRQALAGLRKAIGAAAGVVQSQGNSLSLDWSCADCDARTLINTGEEAGSDDPDWLIGLGSLFEGLDLREPPFEDWVALERQRWMHLLCGRLMGAGEAQIERGHGDKALAIAQRLIHFDDFNEAAHRLAMRALARTGERSSALRHFDALRRKLRDEMGIEPGDATAQLAAEIRAGRDRVDLRAPAKDTPQPAMSMSGAEGDHPIEQSAVLRMVVAVAGRVRLRGSEDNDPDNPLSEAVALEQRDLIAATIKAHGGLLIQNTGSGFLAVFGVTAAHSNDAERAIICAQALLRSSSARGRCDWRIAVAAGRVLAEGASPRFVGEVPERARDLVVRAQENMIVADQSVRDATQRLFHFDPADRPHLWRLGTRLASDRRPALTTFVGRAAEFARIRDVLGDVASRSEGEVIVVRGEAGIGKTRLVEEIGTLAGSDGFRVVLVGALEFGSGAFEGLVARLAQALLGETPAMFTVLDTAILAELTGREPDPAEREMLATLNLAGRASEQARVIGVLLAATAAQSPLLLVVEDLHWAAPAAVTILADVAAAARDLPVAFILTTRPQNDPIDAGWRRRCAGLRVGTIDLAPLRTDAARRLVLSVGELPSDLVESCVDRAEGNPLFLEHLARSAPRMHSGQLPLSVHSVVQEELDQLSPQTCLALRAGSVLGLVFTPDACTAVNGTSPTIVDDLLATDLVVHRGDRLGFVHALVRDGVYASIPARDRAAMHLRAAAWFVGRDPALRAEHLDIAGDPGAADAYLFAAEEERHGGRPAEALRLVERAQALASEVDLVAQIGRLHGDLLADLERFIDAIDIYRSVTGADAGVLCACHLGTAECLMRLDRHDEALRSLDEADRLVGDGPATPRMATIPYLRSTIQFAQGASAQSIESAKIAQGLARQTGDRLLEARALSAMADAEQACGRFRSAERAFAACVEISNELGLRRYALINKKMCADLRFYDAEFGEARAMLEEVRGEARTLGSGRAEMLAEHMLAYIDCAEAKYDQALARARRARELVDALKAQRFVMNNACFAAMALSGLGRNHEALERLAEAEAVARKLNVTWILPWVLAQRALAEPTRMDATRALDNAEALIQSGAGSYPFEFYRPAIDAAIRIRDWQRIKSYAEALAAFFAEERVGCADFVIRRAEQIASAYLDRPDRSALDYLITRARKIGYHSAIPSLQEALDVG